AEGAMSRAQHARVQNLLRKREDAKSKEDRRSFSAQLDEFHQRHTAHTLELSQQLESLTGQESRLTILGHLLRGGTPSATDRVLATRVGTAAAEMVENKCYGMMAAVQGEEIVPVPLADVAGKKKLVPIDHPWLTAARSVDTCFGD
ncbi:MAG: 6-phosphofructokinase, partial [Myxococcota bacterium]